MFIALSLSAILLSFSCARFSVSAFGEADFLSGKARVRLRLLGIPVLDTALNLESFLPLSFGESSSGEDFRSTSLSLPKDLSIMNYATIEEIDVEAKVGVGGNAFFTAMAAGALRTVVNALVAYLRSRSCAEVYRVVSPEYEGDKMSIAVRGIIRVSVANIILGSI